MINTIDLSECEVLLPGEWTQVGSGEQWTFTADKMQLRDVRLFRTVYIHQQPVPYALSIRDEYIGIFVGAKEYTILSITANTDGSATMEWEDDPGHTLRFERSAAPGRA